MSRRRARGFALPLVLAVAACALLLVLASASSTWRAYRGARHALAAARADLAAERGVAELVGDALRDSVLARPLADTLRTQLVDADGLTLTRVAVRPSPFALWVAVTSSEGGGGEPSAVRATRIRAERLAPPPWPLLATVVATSPLDARDAMLVGTVGGDRTDCVGAVHADVAAAREVAPDSVRAVWVGSWSAAVARGAPWRAETPADLPADARWRVHVIPERDSVLTGPRRWQGVLLHDGPLRLVGTFDGRGLLVVRGALDASAARLSLHGAVLVDDPGRAVVHLGPASLHWNRCAVSMALATLAVPRAAPFETWVGVTP